MCLGNDGPAIASCDGARSLIDIRAEHTAEIRVDFGNIIKAAADAADNAVLEEGREGHIDGSAAGDIEEILRHERATKLKPPDAVKYSVFHSLHGHTARFRFRKTIPLFLNASF